MFRIGFVVILLAFAAIIGISTVATRATHSDSSPATLPQSPDHTKTGVDVLEEQNFAPLRGKRVGLITNQTGVDSQGRRTIDVLAHADNVKLVALFSPEHGIAGQLDAKVGNTTDAATGLQLFSLYGDTRRRKTQNPVLRSRSSRPARRRKNPGPDARSLAHLLRRIFPLARRLCHDAGRVSSNVQRRK